MYNTGNRLNCPVPSPFSQFQAIGTGKSGDQLTCIALYHNPVAALRYLLEEMRWAF